MARLREPVLSAEDDAVVQKLCRQVKRLERELNLRLEDDDIEDFDELMEADEKLNERLMDMYRFYYGNLSEKTIDRQTNLLSLYLEHTFGHSQAVCGEALQVGFMEHYLGYWFITHVLTSGPTGIKDTCSALKKLASMMYRYKLISADQLDDVNSVIKENKDRWLDNLRRYEDLDPGAADFETKFGDIFY